MSSLVRSSKDLMMYHIQCVCGSFDPIRYSEGQFYGDATFENPRVCELVRQKHLAQLWHS